MKKGYNYFDTFVKMVDYSCQTANILNQTLQDYDPVDLEAQLYEIHQIEHEADIEQHLSLIHI